MANAQIADAKQSPSLSPFDLQKTFQTNLSLWLRSDAGVVTNEKGFVTQWDDQSGNENHAKQSHALFMPLLAKDTVSHQPVLRFNGITNYLEIPDSDSMSITGDMSVFAVVRVESYDTLNGIIGKTSSNLPAPFDFYIHEVNGAVTLYRGDATNFGCVSGNVMAPLKQMLIVSAVQRGTNAMTYLNGAFNGSADLVHPGGDLGGSTLVGSRDDRVARLQGDLAEIILMNRAVDDLERREIHSYLGKKYGIETILDFVISSPPAIHRSEGQTATFSVGVAASSPKVGFQWQKNGVNIRGATNATYTTPPLALSDNGSVYRVRVSMPGTNAYSSTTLAVVPDTEPITVSTAAFLLRDQSPSATNEGNATLPPYAPRFWQTGEDSARSTVQAIAQTADGFLWVGTQGGLARFDGTRFEFVPVGSAQKNLRVNALLADSNGGLWVGTTQGLFRWHEGEWKTIFLPDEANEAILSLYQNADGSLWAGTRNRLVLVKEMHSTSPSPTNVLRQVVRTMAQSHDGNVWASVVDSLFLLKGESVITNLYFGAFKTDFIRAICSRRDGSLWVGGNSGLIRFREGEYAHYSKTNGLPDNTMTAIYEDRRGNFWIGTYGGLCRWVDGKFVMELTPEGDPFDQIFCFFEDRENNLWVGAKNGLYQLNIQQFTTYTTRHGLAHNNVISVYEDDAGTMWIGTWGGGLHQLRGGRITIYSSAKIPTMRNDLVLAIYGAKDGIWFSEDYDGGLYRFKNGDFRHYGPNQGLNRSAIRALMEDQESRLWAATSSGFIKVLQNEKMISYDRQQGLPTNAIRCLLRTSDEQIWVGTELGLCLFTNGQFQTFSKINGLPDEVILSLCEDKTGDLWVGTDKGLCRMRRGNENFAENQRLSTPVAAIQTRFTHYFNNLPQEAILEIVEDDFENLWLSTRRGIFRVNKKELLAFDSDPKHPVIVTQFGKAEGMASPVCVGVAKPSAIKSRDGRLWFATTKGLAVTDPKLQVARNEKPPPVVIQEVRVDKEVQSLKFNAQRRDDRSVSPILNLTPGRGELEIHYTALSYSMPEKNRFKYKLEGLDRDWVDAGERHAAFYNNVPPGDYTFRVIACNNDGVWNQAGSSLMLSLQPHVWQSWWVKTSVVLVGIAFVALGARFLTKKRMQFKLERLEQQHAIEKERTRIAQDMHDDLGARLTEILLLSDRVQKSKSREESVETGVTISQVTREVASGMNAIVWAVNPKNDSLDKMAGYISNYAVKFLARSSIECLLDFPSELPSRPVSSETRHNVFLVVKEALNNVVKHSGASEVRLTLRLKNVDTVPQKLELIIEDNGRGFSTSETSAFGNGLLNMRKRMEAIGGCLETQSQPGKGTSIRLEIPLRDTRLI